MGKTTRQLAIIGLELTVSVTVMSNKSESTGQHQNWTLSLISYLLIVFCWDLQDRSHNPKNPVLLALLPFQLLFFFFLYPNSYAFPTCSACSCNHSLWEGMTRQYGWWGHLRNTQKKGRISGYLLHTNTHQRYVGLRELEDSKLLIFFEIIIFFIYLHTFKKNYLYLLMINRLYTMINKFLL